MAALAVMIVTLLAGIYEISPVDALRVPGGQSTDGPTGAMDRFIVIDQRLPRATAAVVVLVALRRGIGGETLVLAGIALSEVLPATNDYLVSRATIQDAEVTEGWQYVSLDAITWAQVRPLALAAVLVPLVVWLARPAGILELGADAATGLGLSTVRVRGAVLGYGVVLAPSQIPVGLLSAARGGCASSGGS